MVIYLTISVICGLFMTLITPSRSIGGYLGNWFAGAVLWPVVVMCFVAKILEYEP